MASVTSHKHSNTCHTYAVVLPEPPFENERRESDSAVIRGSGGVRTIRPGSGADGRGSSPRDLKRKYVYGWYNGSGGKPPRPRAESTGRNRTGGV